MNLNVLEQTVSFVLGAYFLLVFYIYFINVVFFRKFFIIVNCMMIFDLFIYFVNFAADIDGYVRSSYTLMHTYIGSFERNLKQ